MEATRNLRDVAYERVCVCLCVCEIMLCGVCRLCVSVHMCGYIGTCVRSWAYVQGTSLSQQVCLISVALHAAGSAVAKWVTATRWCQSYWNPIVQPHPACCRLGAQILGGPLQTGALRCFSVFQIYAANISVKFNFHVKEMMHVHWPWLLSFSGFIEIFWEV